MEKVQMNTNHIFSNQASSSADVSLLEMMHARDMRCALQRHLLEQYEGSTLICLTLNIPGPVKVLNGVPRAFDAGCAWIRQALEGAGIPLLHFESVKEKTGYEAFFSVDGDARTIKQLMIRLEDHSRLGRLFDLDVLQEDGTKLSREDLGFAARRCLLCGEPAQVCARSRRHSVAELVSEIQNILSDCQNLDFPD